jgi:hypothetical protein
MVDLTGVTWRKSSHSGGNGGDCVEIASLVDGRRGVRDSKNPGGPALVVGADAWDVFRAALRAGDP